MSTEGKQITIGGPAPEPFSLCMLCEAEYGLDQQICPKCAVTLSVVRRCPGCAKIVSGKHKRCIYCSYPLMEDQQKTPTAGRTDVEIAQARLRRHELIEQRIRRRAAAVSIAVFVLVFILGSVFISRMNFGGPSKPTIIATSYVLRSTEARRAPTGSSAQAAQLSPSDMIKVAGFRVTDQGSRWVEIEQDDATVFVRSSDIAPPKVNAADTGYDLLKFYLIGMNAPEVVPDAVQAVNYFAQAFPGNSGIAELRWILADRARHLASKASDREAMLKEARTQYEILASSGGDYAERARRALAGPLQPAFDKAEHSAPSAAAPAQSAFDIVDGRTDPQKYAGFTKSPAHEVLLVDHSRISVTFEMPAKLQPGAALNGRLTRNIYVGKVVAIPAGSRCTVQLVGDIDLSKATVTTTLASITVRDHTYEIKSTSADVRRTTTAGTTRSADFVLDTPVAITR